MIAKCPTSEELRAFSLGELSEEQSDEMLGHVQTCDDCRSDLDTDAAEDTLIKSLRSANSDAFADESDCQIAMAKALGALAASDAVDHTELSQLLPKVLGDYEIVRSLGRGGMGNVYLARHQKLGREVALKVLSSHRLLQPRMRQRFDTEMRAVGQLSHPNIVTAYDAREVDDVAVLVTEYIDGLDVAQVLRRRGKLSIADACEIAKQTAQALDYVNQQGLVHRDIKPSNVMLSRDGDVKLLDLGLARLRVGDEDSPEMTATGQAMGTADYIAPEQVNDSRNVDIRADIYALGCTLFKMLSGRAPFGTDQYPTSFAKMTAHVSDAPPKLQDVASEVPKELASLVDQMIAKNPADRPANPAEVVKRLSNFSKSAALGQLAEDALNSGVVADLSSNREPAAARRPTPVSFFSRRVPIFAAIGAGLLGALVGLLLGITITINHPDGTANQVQIPPGATANVDKSGDVSVELSGESDKSAGDSSDDSAAVDPLATSERLEGIWRAVSWGHEAQVPPNSAAATPLFVFHDGKFFPVMNGQFLQDPLPYSIKSEKTFSLLTFRMDSEPQMEMKASIRFLDEDHFEMTSEGGPKTIVERLTALPVTPVALKQIQEIQETAVYAETIKKIDAFCRTGELPPGNKTMQSDAKHRQSNMKVRMLGLAIMNYESANSRFPASATKIYEKRQDPNAKPVSWRVKVLPFLDEQAMYDAYRFDEEWNSEHNQKILESMPDALRHPDDPAGATSTRYLAVASEDSIIGDRSLKIGDIRDGTAKTILIVEGNKSVPWTKPDDISPEEILEWTKSKDFKGLHAAFADGAPRFLSGSLVEEHNLKGLMTANGGEAVKNE